MATNEPQVLAEAGSLAQDISLPTIMDANIKVDDIDLYHGNPAKPKILEVTDKIIKGLMEEPQKMSLQEQVKAFLCCKGKYWNKDIQARWVRFWAIGGVPIVMLFIMNELTNGGWGSETYYLGPMLGIGIALMFSFYFVNLIIQLGPGRIFRYLIPKCCQERSKCCDKLANRGKLKYKQDGSENDEASKEDDMGKGEEYFFKIETRLTQVKDWATMRIANTQVMFKLRPIQSISEFSAISGGQANQMIANLGPFAWVGVVMMYIAHMQCHDGSDFHLDFTDVLLVIGVNGIVMIGMFELNQFDPGMKHGHYIGVGMAICILVACMAQGISLSQTPNGATALVVPIVLNAIAWPCFIYWQGISDPKRCMRFERQFDEEFKKMFGDLVKIKVKEKFGEKLSDEELKNMFDDLMKINGKSKDTSSDLEWIEKELTAGKINTESEWIGKKIKEIKTEISKIKEERKKWKEDYDRKREEWMKEYGVSQDESEMKIERRVWSEKYMKENNLRGQVHKLSIKCVAFEGTAIYCTTLALSWYLWQWGNTCYYGCITCPHGCLRE